MSDAGVTKLDDNVKPVSQAQEIQVFVMPTELFVEVAELIQDLPIRQGHKTYTKLMALRPQTARVDQNG